MALIDLGAEDSFLDENLTLQSGIPLKPLESLLTVSTLDGRFLACVVHIDWSKKMISWSPFSLPVHAFNPSFCQQRSLLYNPEAPDLSSIPTKYHDLGQVFSEDLALSLPPHDLLLPLLALVSFLCPRKITSYVPTLY